MKSVVFTSKYQFLDLYHDIPSYDYEEQGPILAEEGTNHRKCFEACWVALDLNYIMSHWEIRADLVSKLWTMMFETEK